MAGVKGRSGGARPGAGRKKKAPAVLAPAVKPEKAAKPAKAAKAAPAAESRAAAVPAVLAGIGEAGFDPRPALEQVALGLLDPSPTQMKALIALMPYVHTKKGEGGKKEQRQDEAKKVASRFAPAAPPRLVAAGGKKV